MATFRISTIKVWLAIGITSLCTLGIGAALLDQLSSPSPSQSLLLHPFVLVSALFYTALYVVWSGRQILGTSITADGIKQPGVLAPVYVPWSEVVHVDLTSSSKLRMRAPGAEVSLHLYMYEAPIELIAYAMHHLQRHGRIPAAA